MIRDFGRMLPLKSALSLLMVTYLSAPLVAPCWARQAPQLKPIVVSEKPTLALIEKLGHQPELLTPEYLQYVLGRPAKRNVSDANNVVYHWQTSKGGIGSQDCELAETRDANHRIIKACFIVNLPRSTTTITDIEKTIKDDSANYYNSTNQPPGQSNNQVGQNQPPLNQQALNQQTLNQQALNQQALNQQALNPQTPNQQTPNQQTLNQQAYQQPGAPSGPKPVMPKKLFDQQCRPSLQYKFVPYTQVTYTQAANTYHVHRAEIVYAGPPLPPPNQADIAEAATGMRSRALAHHTGDNHQLAIPMLQDHLIDNPGDAEAHYALGLSYQKSSHLNEAIAQYQLALRYSNGDNTVSDKAVQSLQQLHVLPSPDDRFDYHTIKFKQDGQGLTEGDVIASQDRQSMISNSAPFYSNNAPMMPAYMPPSYPSGYSSGYSSASNAPSFANYQRQASGVQPGIQPAGSPRYAPLAPTPANGWTPVPSSSVPSAIRYTPWNGNAPSGQATPSFYDSMQYGSNLFPATANMPNLEPGF